MVTTFEKTWKDMTVILKYLKDCPLQIGLFLFGLTPEGGTRANWKNYLAITSAPKENRLICEMGNSST